jgi:hypothetical protein
MRKVTDLLQKHNIKKTDLVPNFITICNRNNIHPDVKEMLRIWAPYSYYVRKSFENNDLLGEDYNWMLRNYPLEDIKASITCEACCETLDINHTTFLSNIFSIGKMEIDEIIEIHRKFITQTTEKTEK